MPSHFTIEGLQKAQQANARIIANLKPAGALGRAVQYATIELQRYAVTITHVDTGSLKASHRMDVNGLRGEIYLDPSAVNPRSLEWVTRYGPIEHARGGSHAFYQRTRDEAGHIIAMSAAAGFIKELP